MAAYDSKPNGGAMPVSAHDLGEKGFFPERRLLPQQETIGNYSHEAGSGTRAYLVELRVGDEYRQNGRRQSPKVQAFYSTPSGEFFARMYDAVKDENGYSLPSDLDLPASIVTSEDGHSSPKPCEYLGLTADDLCREYYQTLQTVHGLGGGE